MPEGDDPLYEAIEFLRAHGHSIEPDEEFERWRVNDGDWLSEAAVIALAVELGDVPVRQQ